MELRGITISVNYSEVLKITLVRNMRHLSECLVVTDLEDHATREVCQGIPGVHVLSTDAFTRHGARFNKGLGMEEGFDAMGRHGQIVIWDADILFPNDFSLGPLKPDTLHGCRRRMLENVAEWHPDVDWTRYPHSRDGGPIGFWQCFNADDPAIRDKRPWYDVSFSHAGGGDAAFIMHWTPLTRKVLPIDVLHLGQTDVNWFGTDQQGRDMMARFVRENGWRNAVRKHSEESASRSPEVIHRVDVPGYGISDFELPFVKRAQMRPRMP